MQVLGLPLSSWEGLEGSSSSSEGGRGNAQEKMRRLMDLPATDDLEWTRHDRWTALMEVMWRGRLFTGEPFRSGKTSRRHSFRIFRHPACSR